MAARRLIIGIGSKSSRLIGARGLEMFADRVSRIRWRKFVLVRVDRTHWRSVRNRLRKYLKAMRQNKRATHIRRSLSDEPKQKRYICNNYLALKAMRRNNRATYVTYAVLYATSAI